MIKAENIAQKEFRKSLYGYDCEEVDSYLDELILQLRQMEQERLEMASTIEYLVGQLQQLTAPAPEGDPFVAPVAKKQLMSRTGRMRLSSETEQNPEQKAMPKDDKRRAEQGKPKKAKPAPKPSETRETAEPKAKPASEPVKAESETAGTETVETTAPAAVEAVEPEAETPVPNAADEPQAESKPLSEAEAAAVRQAAQSALPTEKDDPFAPLTHDDAHEA